MRSTTKAQAVAVEEEATEADGAEEEVVRWNKETFNAGIVEKKVTWQETANRRLQSQHDYTQKTRLLTEKNLILK